MLDSFYLHLDWPALNTRMQVEVLNGKIVLVIQVSFKKVPPCHNSVWKSKSQFLQEWIKYCLQIIMSDLTYTENSRLQLPVPV